MIDKYLKETCMLDYSNPEIQELIQKMKWKELDEFERIKAIYNFVRDDILFGYNEDDAICASKVLFDGYGQCNTKGTLFMALLRACHGSFLKSFINCETMNSTWNLTSS